MVLGILSRWWWWSFTYTCKVNHSSPFAPKFYKFFHIVKSWLQIIYSTHKWLNSIYSIMNSNCKISFDTSICFSQCWAAFKVFRNLHHRLKWEKVRKKTWNVFRSRFWDRNCEITTLLRLQLCTRVANFPPLRVKRIVPATTNVTRDRFTTIVDF